MRITLGLAFALALALTACSEPQAAYYGQEGFADDLDDPGENPVKDEIRTLPFKDIVWEYKFNNRQISRMTLGGSQLFIETPDNTVIAMDRFSGETQWMYRIDTDTPLDWPPVVAEGVPEEIRDLEKELQVVGRQIEDIIKEKGIGPDVVKMQKKRQEVRERLRVAAFGDNVYFLSQHILYCLDRTSGILRWTKRLRFVPSAQPFAIRNYVFIAGSDRARVWALDVENKGNETASYKAALGPRENHVMNRPVYSDPSLYFVCHDGDIYCYRVTDGTRTWQYPTERSLRANPVVYTYREMVKTPEGKDRLTSRRYLLVGGTDHAFYALDADAGALEWKYEAGAVFKDAAVAKDSTVYVKTEDSALLALELVPMHKDPKTGESIGAKRNGHLRWKLPLGERFLVKGADRVYVLGPRKEIYAIREMSGEIVGRYPTYYLNHLMTNTADSLLYAANGGGHVFCLRESKTSF